jgi:hypothetical protein
MPGPNSGNTYTCTCTRFCKGYKTGLSRATYYRHAQFRHGPPEFSASFQAFLQNSSVPVGGPSTGSNLEVLDEQDSQDETFDNERVNSPEVSRILLLCIWKQKVASLSIYLSAPSPI